VFVGWETDVGALRERVQLGHVGVVGEVARRRAVDAHARRSCVGGQEEQLLRLPHDALVGTLDARQHTLDLAHQRAGRTLSRGEDRNRDARHVEQHARKRKIKKQNKKQRKMAIQSISPRSSQFTAVQASQRSSP